MICDLRDVVSAVLLAMALVLFVAGTVGLLRFPDVYNRLHATTKVDNLGLGLIVLGLALQASSVRAALVLLLVWALVLISSTNGAQLTARAAFEAGEEPWTRA